MVVSSDKNAPNLSENRSLKTLLFQIFSLKNFLWFIGPLAVVFLTAYLSREFDWNKAFPFFSTWAIISPLWLLFLIFSYGLEFWRRLANSIQKVVKNFAPLVISFLALYLILLPINTRKLLGFGIIVIVYLYWAKNTLLVPKVIKKEKRRVASKDNAKKETDLLLNDVTVTETSNAQGTNFIELPLDGKRIKYLQFYINSHTGSWKAGLKVTSANDGILPLLSAESLLFHLGNGPEYNNENFGLAWYLAGTDDKYNGVIKSKKDKVKITLEVNKNNFVKCKVGRTTQFNKRINPAWLEKAYLAAWGDGTPFRVTFSNIKYKTR